MAACPFVFSAPPAQRPTRPGAVGTQSPASTSAPAPAPAPKVEREAPAPRPANTHKTGDSGARPGKLVPFSGLCSNFGLKFRWTEQDKAFVLSGSGLQLEFEVDSRECRIRGQRVFLGEAVRLVKGVPHLSQTDAQVYVTPLLRPGYNVRPLAPLKVIMLDPGHGGNDSGKTNTRLSLAEKTLALDTALRLQKLLEAQGYKVFLTRHDDRFVELPDRPELAEKVGAQLFISIHFNSVEAKADTVTGVEVFTLAPQWQLSTDQKPDPVYAPLQNPGNEHDHWNTAIGGSIHRAMIEELKVPDRGFKRSRFAVLRLAPCPAVLVESGYLSNDSEARRVATPQYRQRIAEAIASGVSHYAEALEAARRARH
jgi:N-acetylmuramoyl-L-alanine amidase